MTAAELKREYQGLRELWLDTGQGKSRVANAYERYFAQACAEGRPPDALVQNTGPEDERFFAHLIAGVDGHNYWGGPQRFGLDNGRERNPRYWWYEHLHGELPGRGAVKPVCGELHCITPAHQRFVSWSELKRLFTDEQLLGAVQVMVMRLGHSPSTSEYDTHRGRGPTSTIIGQRFGGWNKALRAAGYGPSDTAQFTWSAEQCVEALQFVTERIGHPPSNNEYRRLEPELRARTLPTAPSTIRKYLAPTWAESLKKAGLK